MTDANARAALLDAPNQAAIRALIYLVWVGDGTSPQTFEKVQDAARRLEATPAQQAAAWLDVEEPPTILDLHRLRRSIRADMAQSKPPELDQETQSLLWELTGLDLRRLQNSLAGTRPAGTHTPLRWTQEEKQQRDALAKLIEGEGHTMWQQVANILREDSFRYLDAPTVEEHRRQVLEWIQRLADKDVAAAFFKDDFSEVDLTGMVQTFAALSTFDLSLVVKFGVQFGLFGGSTFFLGTERHHKNLLPAIVRGELLGGFAMTESGHGSDVKSIETTATFDAAQDGFVLHSPTRSSWKEWIGNAARDGQAMTVFAQLAIEDEHFGVHAFYVPIRDDEGALLEGIRIEDCGYKMGLNGVDNGRIAFDHVFVPREHLLDRYAQVDKEGRYTSDIRSEDARFFTMLGTLVGGRLSVAFGALTAARTALLIAIHYGLSRRQFGPENAQDYVVMDYIAHQERLIPALAEGVMLHVTMNDLLQRFEAHSGQDRRELEGITAGMKAHCTWYAVNTTQECRECCGGQGYLMTNRIAQIRRDVDVFATFEGDNVVLMNLFAKNELSGYARAFQQDLALSMLRQLRSLAEKNIVEKNPVIRGKTDEKHLRSSEYHVRAMKLRADSLLSSAARRIKKRTDDGKDPFDAFSDIGDHIQALGRARIEYEIVQTTAAWIDTIPEGEHRELLEKCRQLTALNFLYQSRTFYLENGFMDAGKARAIRKIRLALIRELRSHAFVLSGAITHANDAVGSPIGTAANA